MPLQNVLEMLRRKCFLRPTVITADEKAHLLKNKNKTKKDFAPMYVGLSHFVWLEGRTGGR